MILKNQKGPKLLSCFVCFCFCFVLFFVYLLFVVVLLLCFVVVVVFLGGLYFGCVLCLFFKFY